uniref:Uncharacterized protein n=1 Tax=Panagrolaimus superbus TaxID=310955 RepID=A0A914YZU4_9BILA
MNPTSIFKNIEIPLFPFPKTVMNYIFANGKPRHYKKLNKTCKYIFIKYQRNCVDWIHLQEDYVYYDEDPEPKPVFERYKFLTRFEKDFALLPSNLMFSSALELNRATTILYKTLMPKIVICNIGSLTMMRSADFLYDDFKFLTNSGRIQTLNLYDTKIIYPNGDPVEIENILAKVINAWFITLNPVHITQNTMKNLLEIQWGRPILMMLRLTKIDNNYFQPDQFFELLQKIASMSVMKGHDRYIVEFKDPIKTQEFNIILSKMVKEYKEPVPEAEKKEVVKDKEK